MSRESAQVATGPQAATAAPLIQARDLGMTYRTARGDKVVALDGLDFAVADGEFISVVGPSGCGKSTLMKILAGLLSRTEGEISLGGRSVAGPGPDVGVVFQAPVLLPWRTILQNVLLPTEMRRLPAPRDRAMALLETVGLAGFEKRYPHELSGGMQQRASIVRALVGDPKLLLMDEPFGALDAMTRDQMNEEVLRIWHASRKTVVFITHSIAEAVFLSDRVFVMTPRPGRLVEIIGIGLPRPRTLRMVNTDAFGAYADRIRLLLNAPGNVAG